VLEVIWNNKLLLHVHQVLTFLFIERMKAILQYLTNANNLEILENNGRLHIIRIMVIHSLVAALFISHTYN